MNFCSILRWPLFFGVMTVCSLGIAAPSPSEKAPSDKSVSTQAQVSVKVFINKIYQIDTINETYRIDAYLVSSWTDTVNVDKKLYSKKTIFENDMVDKAITDGLWIPALDFINVIEGRNVSNKRVVISLDGDSIKVKYNERFDALFTTPMDFRQFPFDSQVFTLEIESFSYPLEDFRFKSAEVLPQKLDNILMGEWELKNEPQSRISSQHYDHLEQDFSRITFDINVQRRSDFYIFQFFLPLTLIIIASWSVFWIVGLDQRLSVSFTLMLTVVAYNYYTSTLLPPLPFTTFIDRMIIFGYISIFAAIIAAVAESLRQRSKAGKESIINACRVIFPLGSILAITILVNLGFSNG